MAKGIRSGLCVKAVACSVVLAAMGCSAGADPDSSTRTLEGQLGATALPSTGAVIVAQALDGPRFVAAVDRNGKFRLTVPTGNTYRLLIARRLASGAYAATSRVSFPMAASRTRWVEVPRNGASVVSLGTVRALTGSNDVATRSYGYGGGGSGSGGSDDTSSSGSGSSGSGSSGSGSEDDASGDGSDDKGGEAGGGDDCSKRASAKADLPYDVRPGVGDTFTLADAFAAKGSQPASIVSVTMDGGAWRLKEIAAGVPFTVTQADCDHAGNRDTGRDRIFVTWKNVDGSTETDHLDMRYCKGGGGSGSGGSSAASAPATSPASDDCADDDEPVCAPADAPLTECTCEPAPASEVKPTTACDSAAGCEGTDEETEGACAAAPGTTSTDATTPGTTSTDATTTQ